MRASAWVIAALCMLGIVAGCDSPIPCPNPADADACAIWTTVDGLICSNPIYKNLKPDLGCKENSRKWILTFQELFPYVSDSLATALTTLTIVKPDRSVVMNASQVLAVLQRADVPLSKGFCSPICNLFKLGCGCADFIYQALIDMLGGDEAVSRTVMKIVAQKCNDGHASIQYTAAIVNTPECDAKDTSVGDAWTCS